MLYKNAMKKREIRDNLELNNIIDEIILNSTPVKHYRGDISYDIIRLVDYDRAKKYHKLYWIVRECGTWLFDMEAPWFSEDMENIHQVNDDIKREFIITYNANEQLRWSIERTV